MPGASQNTTGNPRPRNYCILLDGRKYNRNLGCKAHDNAYGIHGGGTGRERRQADRALYAHMRANADPMAFPAFFFVRLYGWLFFNYHKGLWQGQLLKKCLRPPKKP